VSSNQPAFFYVTSMSVLKHIAGILLAAIGVLFALGAIAHFFDPEPDIPFWMSGIMLVVLGLFPLVGAFALLRTTVLRPSKPCPQCGGKDHQAAGILRHSHNPWLFHFGGWLFASLWGASRERQVRCVQCDKLYFTETRGTRIAGVCLWVFLLLLVIAAIVEQLGGSRE
jgi:peptidoglycan/LPS O-acetylase OafA/YrhL